jgi:predicted nucleic acid-binding protein
VTTFVDTSAFLALLDADQPEHAAAASVWRTLLQDDEPLLTNSYVLVETYALVQRRLGIEAVRVFARDFAPLVEVDWIDAELHGAGLAALLTANRRQLSLVDCMSFEVMRRRGLARAFALDADFVEQGFDVVPQ